jgi:hypothetical protein
MSTATDEEHWRRIYWLTTCVLFGLFCLGLSGLFVIGWDSETPAVVRYFFVAAFLILSAMFDIMGIAGWRRRH